MTDHLQEGIYAGKQIFTFGHGQDNFPGYVVVWGQDSVDCRRLMTKYYGDKWSMQYPSEEAAGVKQFGLVLRAVISERGGWEEKSGRAWDSKEANNEM